MALTHVWRFSLGTTKIEFLVLDGFVRNTVKVECTLAEAAKFAVEEWTGRCIGCLGWDDIGRIKDNWSIGFSKDCIRADSKLISMDEVLKEVALGGLVDDFYNSSFLADFGDLIAVFLASILNGLTAFLMNIVQLCDVDLAIGHIVEELGLCCFVGFSDLCIDLLVSVCVDLIDSLGLNLCI